MILVLGNVGIDTVFEVAALPRPGETMVARARRQDLGGKALSQAVVARRCGVEVRLVAPVGADAAAERLRAGLAVAGLDTDGLVTVEAPTFECVVLLGADGENINVCVAEAAAALAWRQIARGLATLGPGDVLAMQGNLSLELTGRALAAARERGVRTFLDAAPVATGLRELLPLVDLLMVNRLEAAVLAGTPEPERGAPALRTAGAGAVVVTCGADGLVLAAPGRLLTLPARPVAAVDTLGAGDTVAGVLAAALALDLPLEPACRWAVAAAALTVSRRGTLAALPTAAELDALRPTR